jgi:hypothetical protein
VSPVGGGIIVVRKEGGGGDDAWVDVEASRENRSLRKKKAKKEERGREREAIDE